MKRKQGKKDIRYRSVVVDGMSQPVISDGESFIEISGRRFAFDVEEIDRLFKYMVDFRPYPFCAYNIEQLYRLDGNRCRVRLHSGQEGEVSVWVTELGVAGTTPESKPPRKPSPQHRHGPDNRPKYNRRTNPELGNQLCAWFRKSENREATLNAGAKWAASLFDRKGGPLGTFRLPCPSVLWREAKKQKPKARFQR